MPEKRLDNPKSKHFGFKSRYPPSRQDLGSKSRTYLKPPPPTLDFLSAKTSGHV